MVARDYAVMGATVAALAIFLVLAQSHVILVPRLTPTVLEIQGLKGAYNTNDKVTFMVTAKGYGSNCYMLQVQATGQSGERVSFYKKADDCRFMAVTQGPYNFTRSFEYGSQVMGNQGAYTLDIEFKDLVDGNSASERRSFIVNAG